MVNRFLVGLIPSLPRALVSRVASRYVAGESIEDALRAAEDLNRQGCRVTLAALGEHSDREESQRTLDAYLELLDRIQAAGVDANISIKPTHLGLDVDPDLCFHNLQRLVEEAASRDSFVRIDMENRHSTDLTLGMYRRLRIEHSNLGIVLQSCMRRTLRDVDALQTGNANVRVCKGIYVEPAETSFQSFDRIRIAFVDTVAALFDRDAYVAIATHDEYLLDRCQEEIARRGLDKDRYEFQMLLGVRRGLRQQLQRAGHPMRVYVPYGAEWYDYSIRRLQENPRIAGHVVRALFRP